jgi:transposase
MLEPVELIHLSADMRIAILDELKNTIKGLAAAKRKGRRVGRLKYQKIADSIPLRGTSIHTNTNRWMTKTEDQGWIKISDGNHIKIKGIPWKFKVRGIKQIQNGAEIRDAKLVRRADGYFIHISTSVPYDTTLPGNGLTVGIDMGIKHHITTSDGIKYKAVIDESTRLKRLQRAFSRTEKHSRNHRKIQAKIRRAYQRMVYKRDEEAHKVVNELLRTYDRIAIQNENITGWRKLFGSSIQGAILGRVKARIVALEKRDRAVVIDRKYPTTRDATNARMVVLSLRTYLYMLLWILGRQGYQSSQNHPRAGHWRYYLEY